MSWGQKPGLHGVFSKPRDALGFRHAKRTALLASGLPMFEAQLFMTASAHILMMNVDVLGWRQQK